MALFEQAAELPPAEREPFLGRECGGDRELARHVLDLLAADASPFDLGQVRLPVELETPEREEPAAAAIPAGARIGPYAVVAELGRRGWGAVYLAERADETYRQRVAIKVVHGGWLAGERLRRFQAERQILAELIHPNIARLLDAGETAEGLPYLVMEYVDGLPVDEYCDRERLSVRRRLELFLEICGAVGFAHQRLVVHRDLKPANIVVTRGGEPKLLDFGIAKILDPKSFPIEVERTAEVHRLLTPGYASPEQIRGEPITTATDVYSLGIVLYRLLTGRLPFDLHGDSLTEIERTICETPPPRPSRATTTATAAGEASLEELAALRATAPAVLERQLRGDLDNIVLKALAKEPEQRYRSVEQLAGDLENTLHGRAVVARRATLGYRAGKYVARNKAGLAAVLASVAALPLGLGGQRREAVRANREATAAREVSDFLVELFEGADPNQVEAAGLSARELLDRGVARIDRELVGQPLTQARLMSSMGRAYEQLGLYPTSERLYLAALERRREVLGPDHPEVASSLVQLGDLRRREGRSAEAVGYLEQALALRRRHFAESSPEVAQAQNNLGLAVKQEGDYERARELLTAALEVRRRAGESRREAETLHNLAELESADGHPAAAERHGRESLAIKRRILPAGHISIARTLDATARAVQARGDLEEAERLLRESLAIRRDVLGDDHPAIAFAHNNLANVLHDRRDLDAAETAYRAALEIHRRHSGDENPHVAATLNNLAWLHRDRGDLESAEPLFRRSLELRLAHFGEEHPDVARARHNLAALLQAQGKLADAEAEYRAALELRRRILRPDHPDVGNTAYYVAELTFQRGDADAAAALAEEAVETLELAFEPGHSKVAQARSPLGACRMAQGRYQEAERLLGAGHAALEAAFGTDYRRTREAARWLDELHAGIHPLP